MNFSSIDIKEFFVDISNLKQRTFYVDLQSPTTYIPCIFLLESITDVQSPSFLLFYLFCYDETQCFNKYFSRYASPGSVPEKFVFGLRKYV